MNLPDSAAEGAKWFLLLGLAFYSADAASAVIQHRLHVPEKPLPQTVVSAVLDEVPAQAVPPGLVSLLETTAPKDAEGKVIEKGQTDGKESKVKEAPQVAQLKLQGTIAGAAGAGLAIFEYQGETQVVGTDEVIGGFTVASVTAYNVTLKSEDQTFLMEMESQGGGAATPVPSPVVTQRPKPEPTPEQEVEEREEEPGAILTVAELRNILDNPEGFMGQGFNAKPELNNGEVIGMRVSLNNPNHPMARLGIQNGDLVKSLNGTALEGPESLAQVYRVLRNSTSLRFEVERNGQEDVVEVNLEE